MPGVTRSMPSSSSSSSLSVSDALTNLSKAATVALNAVQGAHDHVYLEVERARAERDDALKALHDAQLDAKDLEGREEGWKAALDKSDLTIKHQAETITQLRTEVQTWKAQLARLEESSRQEIDGWKEQYRRAEHERSRLSARIEELIAGQLAWNAAAHTYTAPYTTPRIAYAEIPEPSTSSGMTTKRASTAHSRRAPGTPRMNGHVPLCDDDDLPLTSVSARKPKAHPARNATQAEARSQPAASPNRAPTARRKGNAAAATPQASGSRATPRRPAQTSMPPQSRLIRRVTAVVDVKEEEEDGEPLDDLESAEEGSVYDPDEEPPAAGSGGRQRRSSNASARAKRTRRAFDEDDEDQSAYEDEGAHSEQGGDAEDDELLLGPKTQQTRKPPRTPSQGQSGGTKPPRTGGGGARQPSSAKKRKLVDGDAGAAGGRPGSAKATKTR